MKLIEIDPTLQIKDVERIFDIPDGEITSAEDIFRLVEVPLINAVWTLWQKGIETSYSTANPKYPFAMIGIQPEKLSAENLQFAREALGFRDDDEQAILLKLPIGAQTSAVNVDKFFVELAEGFADQK